MREFPTTLLDADAAPRASVAVLPPLVLPRLELPTVPVSSQRCRELRQRSVPREADRGHAAGGASTLVVAPIPSPALLPIRSQELAPIGVGDDATSRLARAWGLKLVVCLVEVVVAMVAGSVMLAADSIHLGVDLAAFGIAWLAASYVHCAGFTGRSGASTFERVAAVVNAVVLGYAAWHVGEEALAALSGHAHHELGAGIALVAALVRLAASHRAMRIMQDGDMANPNERAIEQHCRMDMYASIGMVGVLVFAVLTGSEFADPLVALLIAAMMVRAAYGILRITFVTH